MMIIELTRMAPTGEAIGIHEGLVVFVSYGMPGDLVEVEIIQKRKSFARARITHVLRSSPSRTAPTCKYFQTCGGCEWQHVGYDQQLSSKTQAVREQLTRIGGIKDVTVEDCIPSPEQYYYRNHTQFVLSPNAVPGYRKAASQTVVEVDNCPIIDPALNIVLETGIQNVSRSSGLLTTSPNELPGNPPGEIHMRVGVYTGESTTFITEQNGSIRLISDSGVIHERIGPYTYRISPGSFFQINTRMADILVPTVLTALDLHGEEDVLDLYCGVGLFTAPIAAQAHFVLGIESNASASADAVHNLRGLSNATIMTSDVSAVLSHPDLNRHWHAVVVDPPRAGVEYRALLDLLHLKPARLVYVSCDPATLARDARIICDRGYQLDMVQPLDMFPQTHHVETVAVFTLAFDA